MGNCIGSQSSQTAGNNNAFSDQPADLNQANTSEPGENSLTQVQPVPTEQAMHPAAANWPVLDDDFSMRTPATRPHSPFNRNTAIVDAPASIVSARIAVYMQQNSLAGDFDAENGTALAHTDRGNTYEISISNYGNNQTLVFGRQPIRSDYYYEPLFPSDIIRAAKNTDISSTQRPEPVLRAQRQQAHAEQLAQTNGPFDDLNENEHTADLANAILPTLTLIDENDRIDADYLHQIQIFTDIANGTYSNIIKAVSRAILEDPTISAPLLTLIEAGPNNQISNNPGSHNENHTEQREHANTLYKETLKTVSNILKNCETDDQAIRDIVDINPNLVEPDFLQQLINDLSHAHIRPHNATEAATILNILQCTPEAAKHILANKNILGTLRETIEVGMRTHAKLAQAATNLLADFMENTAVKEIKATLRGTTCLKIINNIHDSIFPPDKGGYQSENFKKLGIYIETNPNHFIVLHRGLHESLDLLDSVELEELEDDTAKVLSEDLNYLKDSITSVKRQVDNRYVVCSTALVEKAERLLERLHRSE